MTLIGVLVPGATAGGNLEPFLAALPEQSEAAAAALERLRGWAAADEGPHNAAAVAGEAAFAAASFLTLLLENRGESMTAGRWLDWATSAGSVTASGSTITDTIPSSGLVHFGALFFPRNFFDAWTGRVTATSLRN